MAKSAQSSSTVLKTWNRLSFVNKVYAILFVFLLVAMTISIPFVAGDKQIGDNRNRAAEPACYPADGSDACKNKGGDHKCVETKTGNCPEWNSDCESPPQICSKWICCLSSGDDGQGGGDEADDPTDGATGGNPCNVPGADVVGCEGGGGGGGVGAVVESIKKAVTKPNRETMQAICPFIIDYIDENGLLQTGSQAGQLKQYLKAHNTEYKGWGKINQFSGSEIYRFGKKYCEDFPTPTPTP